MRISNYSKPLTIAIRPEAYDQIKQITDEKRISIAEWIRIAVDMALDKANAEEEMI